MIQTQIMIRPCVVLLLLLLQINILHAQRIFPLTTQGVQLRNYYLQLHVTGLWIKGHHINWETGEPDDPNADHNIKTHCSVFVAAACERKNVYILRPPAHKQSLLANAQYDWLQSREATDDGWREITGSNTLSVYESAQEYANNGCMVVAVYQNPNPKKSGHSALVMPQGISKEEIDNNGPDLIMAGHINANDISLKKGFEKHISQWPEPAIRFYCNIKTGTL
jgi:hypothetical protein